MNSMSSITIASEKKFVTLVACIKEIRDPRVNRNIQHPFVSIVVIAICAVLGGANNWVAVAEFGKNHYDWFSTFLSLPWGIPSHDTFNDVFAFINHKEFRDWMLLWLEDVLELEEGDDQVVIDGKAIKALQAKNPFTVLRACAGKCRAILSQVVVQRGSNETATLPQLLQQLVLKGKIVTIDAAGTQKNIAAQIIQQGGNYIMPVKGNQRWLHENVTLFLNDMIRGEFDSVQFDYCETEERGHGRHEIRRCWTTSCIDWFDEKHLWKNLTSISIVESIRTVDGQKPTTTRRCYISSMAADAKRHLWYTRNHWIIENGPHYSIDLFFEEDRSTIRKGYGPHNMAFLRSFCYSLLTTQKAKKVSMRTQRNRVNCNFDEMAKTLLPTTF